MTASKRRQRQHHTSQTALPCNMLERRDVGGKLAFEHYDALACLKGNGARDGDHAAGGALNKAYLLDL